MKNKLFVAIFFVLINGFIYAQNIDLKYYSAIMDGDYKSGYKGYASAIYLTNEEIDDEMMEKMEKEIFSKGRELDKLTKNNFWLCWKALEEWEIENGETYMIICADNMNSDNCILIIATIEDNGESFSWFGSLMSSKDLE